MRDSLAKVHPMLLIIYFIVQGILLTLCFHPVIVSISFFCAIIYILPVFGKRKAVVSLLVFAMYVVVFGLVNPFINHQGKTVIGHAFGRNLTFESMFYGMTLGAMFGSLCTWIYIFSKTINSKQLSFLLGNTFPTVSLITFLSLSMFKRYKEKSREIFESRKGFYGGENTLARGKNTIDILLTYALENGVDTADSMSARGYGLGKPTPVYSFHLKHSDAIFATLLLVCFSVIVFAMVGGGCKMYFFPELFTVDFFVLPSYIAFFIFCCFPFITYVWSEIKWKHTR